MASLSPCQKPVAPVRHIAGMEILTALVLTVTAIVAGLLFVAVGLISVASLWWGDLLEPRPRSTCFITRVDQGGLSGLGLVECNR